MMLWVIVVVSLAISAQIELSHGGGQANGLRQWREAFFSTQHQISLAYDLPEEDDSWIQNLPIKNDDEYICRTCSGSASADLIKNGLPGQPNGDFNFSQFSGYVSADRNGNKALFYYFAEAVEGSANPPLIVWFNGGPGCSSLGYGAFEELGPWRVNSDGSSLKFNHFAWNRLVNVLFVESPVGVGFSYANSTSDDYIIGDTQTALDAYGFMLNWFERFPHYKNRSFYIAGESYAGHYVPELAQTILSHQENGHAASINFTGILVGNGLIHSPTDIKGMYTYPWTHALISDKTYRDLIENCLDQPHHRCGNYSAAMNHELGNIDIYSIYAPTCQRRNSVNRSDKNNEPIKLPKDESYEIPGYDPCDDYYIASYLNQKNVQDALHANTTGLPYQWTSCSSRIKWNYTDSPDSMLPIFRNLIQKNLKILIYSGDVDGILPVTSTRDSINVLNLTIDSPWSPWLSDGQVGGYKVGYKGLIFSTVRGAGHEVPQFQPSRMFTLLQSFLQA